MSFFTPPDFGAEEDIFHPLRELRSPISIASIKSIVFDRAGNFSLWSQFRGLLGEFLALGILAAVAVNFSGFRSPVVSGRSLPTVSKSIGESIGNKSSSENYTIIQSPHFPETHTLASAATPSNILPSNSTGCMVPVIPARAEEREPITLQANAKNIHLSTAFSNPPTSPDVKWYSTVSGGAIFSHLRMVGEYAEIGIESGWNTFAIALTNASGSRDRHDILIHRSTASSLLFSESDQTLTLMVGANYPIGPLSCKAAMGPAYLFSSSKFIDSVTGVTGSSSVHNRLGIAAELSAFYPVSDFFQAGVTGISSYGNNQFTGGILLSINITP